MEGGCGEGGREGGRERGRARGGEGGRGGEGWEGGEGDCYTYSNIYSTKLLLTSKEPVCPRVELIFKIIIILLIIFLGFIKSKPY